MRQERDETPRFFADPEEMRAWLRGSHAMLAEQWIGYFKKDSGIASITWPESVDVALCFGWIDGIRKTIDDKRYKVRFTPRRPGSSWSARNLAVMESLIAAGLVEKPGLEVFEARRAGTASPPPTAALSDDYERKIRAHPAAWRFFLAMPPSQRKHSVAWVVSAKREETRLRRLDVLIASCSDAEPIPPLRWSVSRKGRAD